MASKKPAKPMAGQSKQVTLDPNVYGQLTRFIGTKTTPCVCERCKRFVVRGMVRVLNDKFYCSVGCVKPIQNSDD
jgi:hypothetical protein